MESAWCFTPSCLYQRIKLIGLLGWTINGLTRVGEQFVMYDLDVGRITLYICTPVRHVNTFGNVCIARETLPKILQNILPLLFDMTKREKG